jgi:hypothetical protein
VIEGLVAACRVVLVVVCVVMVVEGLFDGRRESDPGQRRRLYFRAEWGAIAAVVFVMAWPS